MTICPLDKEFPIAVEVTDSPLFARLVSHWEGLAENVTELQGHLYQEVIQVTQVQQHVVTIHSEPPVTVSTTNEQTVTYAARVDDTSSDIPAYRDDKITDTLTRLERYHRDYDSRRRSWHRTRIFFKLVVAAFKEARRS